MENVKTLRTFAYIAVVAALLMHIAAAQSATVTPNDALSLVNLKITPTPVVAGSNVTMSFELYNSYNQVLMAINLQLEAQSPIINVSPSSTTLIDSISQGLYGGYGYSTFSYNIHIPSTLPAGEYTIDVVANYQAQTGSGGASSVEPAQSIIPVYIYVYGNPQIGINVYPQEQIVPGHEFTATLDAINSGTDTARNVTVQILNSSSFTADGPSLFSFGVLGPGDSASATASIFTYQNISGGENYLQARIGYVANDGNVVNTTANLPINILLNTPDIVASVTSATPPQLLPGGNQTVSVLIQNTGTGLAENLSVSFLSSNGVSASGAASYFFIGSLAAGGQVTESVFISADRNANQSVYSLPALVSYQYENYQGNVTKTIGVPIRVQDSAIFNVTSSSGAVGIGASYKAVTFKIKNIGNEQATGITLSLQTVYPITPTTPDAYVASLEPGQTANVTFYVNVDSSGNSGQYPITLYEQWRQPNGATEQQYSGSNNYFISVSGAGSAGLIEGIAALVIVAIIGFVVYKKRIEPRMKKKGINSKK